MRANAIGGENRASFGGCKDVNEGDLSDDEDRHIRQRKKRLQLMVTKASMKIAQKNHLQLMVIKAPAKMVGKKYLQMMVTKTSIQKTLIPLTWTRTK
jgi:hypothetical protein